MKKLLNSIKYELKLNFYNKSMFIVTFLMIAIFLIVYNNMMQEFKSNLKIYEHTYSEALENGENIEELLNKEVNIIEEKQNDNSVMQMIDNPLKYDYDNVINSYMYVKDSNIIVGLMKNSTLVFLGMLVGVYMIFLITYEFSENTVKTRLLIDNPIRIIGAKYISGNILIVSLYTISLVFSWILSLIWSKIQLNSMKIQLEYIRLGIKDVMVSIVISYLIIILFSMLGFSIGLLCRKMSISIIVFSVLHMMIPSFGKYDYKNLILTMFSKAYELDMGTKMNFVDGVNFPLSIILFCIYILIIFAFSFIVYIIKKKKGGYV